MAKEQLLSSYDARNRLGLFLKLRKGKTITDQSIKDFTKLIESLWANFKDHDQKCVDEEDIIDHNIMSKAIKVLRSDFIKLDSGGVYLKNKITEFAYYKDQKYRAKIDGGKVEITKADFALLGYVFK